MMFSWLSKHEPVKVKQKTQPSVV